jgi:hypothetical protein
MLIGVGYVLGVSTLDTNFNPFEFSTEAATYIPACRRRVLVCLCDSFVDGGRKRRGQLEVERLLCIIYVLIGGFPLTE